MQPFEPQRQKTYHIVQIIWTATSENVSSDICAHRRFRSACAFAQSDLNLHWAHLRSPWVQRSSCGQRRLWTDCADAQADLSFCWWTFQRVRFILFTQWFILYGFYFQHLRQSWYWQAPWYTNNLYRHMRKHTFNHVRPRKTQISMRIRTV